MKRRKGVTVFAVFALAFAILTIASYGVILYVLLPMVKDAAGADNVKPLTDAFDILARNKDIIAAFTNFDNIALVPHAIVYGYLGLFLILTVIWLIVDLKRGRKIVFFFILVFLLACYGDLIYNLTVLPLEKFITDNIEAQPMLFVPLGGALLGALASLFAVILFIVDMATGKVERQESPTFVKEPTEEVSEGHFEEVKDESEVEQPQPEEKEPEVAPVAAAEEKPQEEVEEAKPEEQPEEQPVEEEKKPAAPKKVKKEPAKKAPAKKAEPKKEEKKPAPAKKAEPKKEEKPAPKKAAPAKKEEPKAEPADARKTGTITLQNEDGKTYAKAFHVSRRPELNKWQVKATGSDKALKLFNTQKEAIEYANQLAKNQNVSVRVHSKEGKIRKHQ